MNNRKTSTLSIRIHDEVKEKLEQSAKRENRSITNYLENLIIKNYKEENEMLKYAVKVSKGFGDDTYYPCDYENIAINKAREFVVDHPEGLRVYIQVFRPSDGQHMYLNPDNGYELEGVNWNQKVDE